ncbi:hypothetical protein CLAFUW4_00142 [Fulvia fulva]|uniref:Uncharacterized protein n=1 Tax=Passalora fulva TaxID=5499 RepID=A0A9Q8L5M6_PASFU|nr:uncharacterized protein CLAFUR5_00140 [Fulvia fulva]KAK4635788.1 hypothetical protein CLAFUR4_00142 [Fulvia fulva]KAK4636366.1 hypothetical protein CLAFUR0_00140 [Fulvia fulva]UJO11316.1 hypothetical protein CLAFUR5_00140 [Fulvia fulva]WPV08921.1 hypothetical protein CLAFUW4_00142 [Fulvia fulva]WPV25246.1 hypothetical protein CLAFUW7_00142 [Fulvia fulva]
MAADDEFSSALKNDIHKAIDILTKQIIKTSNFHPSHETGTNTPQDATSQYLLGAATKHEDAFRFLRHARGEDPNVCLLDCKDCNCYNLSQNASLVLLVILLGLAMMSAWTLWKKPKGKDEMAKLGLSGLALVVLWVMYNDLP